MSLLAKSCHMSISLYLNFSHLLKSNFCRYMSLPNDDDVPWMTKFHVVYGTRKPYDALNVFLEWWFWFWFWHKLMIRGVVIYPDAESLLVSSTGLATRSVMAASISSIDAFFSTTLRSTPFSFWKVQRWWWLWSAKMRAGIRSKETMTMVFDDQQFVFRNFRQYHCISYGWGIFANEWCRQQRLSFFETQLDDEKRPGWRWERKRSDASFATFQWWKKIYQNVRIF